MKLISLFISKRNFVCTCVYKFAQLNGVMSLNISLFEIDLKYNKSKLVEFEKWKFLKEPFVWIYKEIYKTKYRNLRLDAMFKRTCWKENVQKNHCLIYNEVIKIIIIMNQYTYNNKHILKLGFKFANYNFVCSHSRSKIVILIWVLAKYKTLFLDAVKKNNNFIK